MDAPTTDGRVRERGWRRRPCERIPKMCIKNQTGGRINILQGFCGF
jgi:hypothetical protein